MDKRKHLQRCCLAAALGMTMLNSCGKDSSGGGMQAAGRKVARMENTAGDQHYLFTWQGDNLTQVEYYRDGNLATTSTITYNRNLPTQCQIIHHDASDSFTETFNYSYSGTRITGYTFQETYGTYTDSFRTRYEYNGDKIAKCTETAVGESDTYTFTWSGDNVTTESGAGTHTTRYTYDTRRNPFRFPMGFAGFGMKVGSWRGEPSVWCNNNVLREESAEIGSDDHAYTYSYTYDGDWPTSVTRTAYGNSETWTLTYNE